MAARLKAFLYKALNLTANQYILLVKIHFGQDASLVNKVVQIIASYLHFVKYDKIFYMGSSWEKIVALVVSYLIFVKQ